METIVSGSRKEIPIFSAKELPNSDLLLHLMSWMNMHGLMYYASNTYTISHEHWIKKYERQGNKLSIGDYKDCLQAYKHAIIELRLEEFLYNPGQGFNLWGQLFLFSLEQTTGENFSLEDRQRILGDASELT